MDHLKINWQRGREVIHNPIKVSFSLTSANKETFDKKKKKVLDWVKRYEVPSEKPQLRTRVRNTDESVVESGDEDELAVGGELGEGDGGDFIVNESLEARAGSGVPDLAGAVVAGGDDQRAVAVEVHGRHRHRVGPDAVLARAGLDVPHPHRLVERPRHDQARLRVEVHAEHHVRVPAEGLPALAGAGPDSEA